MKAISAIAAVLLILPNAVPGVSGADSPKPEDVGVTLVGAGNLDKELVMDVANHLLATLQVPIHVRSLTGEPTSPEALREQVAAKREKGDLCAIALVKAPTRWPRLRVFPGSATALLVPDAYEPLEPANPKTKATRWRLRVKKETVRAVATLVNMPPCRFPRCGLLVDLNDRQLDAKGYNPCPPCQQRLRVHLEGAGAVVGPRRP